MAKKPVSLEGALGPDDHESSPSIGISQPAPARAAEIDKLTVYMPKAAAKRIKQMALDHDRRVNDFLQEGVELMLAKYGQPGLKDFEKR